MMQPAQAKCLRNTKTKPVAEWLSRDPLGEDGGINLYDYVLDDPVDRYDPLGLCPDGQSADDAGSCCCAKEMQTVQLRIDDSGISGHAFIATPAFTSGFYPTQSISIIGGLNYFIRGGVQKGTANDDSTHPYNPARTRSYKACPDTLKKLMKSMASHATGPYQLGNIDGNNCAGWACSQLQKAREKGTGMFSRSDRGPFSLSQIKLARISNRKDACPLFL